MRKVVLTLVAIGLFFTAAQAQVVGEVEAEGEVEIATILAGDEFEEIDVTTLPELVMAAILTEFPEAISTSAFLKQDVAEAIYKVKLDFQGQEKMVYLDAEGNWIKKEDKKEEDN